MNVVEIHQAGNPVEAHAVRSLLDHEDIEAHVVGDDLSSTFGGLAFGNKTSVALWVAEEDAPRAAEIISQWRAEHAAPDTDHDEAWLQYDMRMLLVNMTLLAIAFAILRFTPADERASVMAGVAVYWIVGNVLAIAYYRKKRRPD